MHRHVGCGEDRTLEDRELPGGAAGSGGERESACWTEQAAGKNRRGLEGSGQTAASPGHAEPPVTCHCHHCQALSVASSDGHEAITGLCEE